MNLRAQASIAFFFVPITAIAACAHSPDGSRAAQTRTTGASFALPGSEGASSSSTEPFSAQSLELAQPEHPANRLATAACERKAECDDIGAAKQYDTSQACLAATRRRAHETLDAMGCENGLDMDAFDACAKEVRKAECIEVDRMRSIAACGARRLCLR